MSVFKVEIMRPGNFGLNTSATLEMPATQAEFQDAMQKARITGNMEYTYELCYCKHDWMQSHLPKAADLHELNILAARIDSHVRDDIDIFKAMVQIDSNRRQGEATPLPRLINLTHSMDNCHVAGNITSDTLLGKFLYENGFLTKEDTGAVQARIDSYRPVSDLFAILGKEHKAYTGGVLTAYGCYVEFDGSINEVYKPGETAQFERPGAPIMLKLFKDNKTAALDLPAEPSRIEDVKRTLGIKDLNDCSYQYADCMIPAAKDWLNIAQDMEQANTFAAALDYMENSGEILKYKALLESVGCGSLENALLLAGGVSEYELDTECPGPEAYAREYLSRLLEGIEGPDISNYFHLYPLGEFLMKHEHAGNTSYGILRHKDDGQILSPAEEPEMTMGME